MFKSPIQLRHQQGKTWSNTGVNDSTFHRAFFSESTVTQFGMMEARMFSSELGQTRINKPLLFITEAQGNVYNLDPGSTEYSWSLATDTDVIMRITRVDANLGTTPGKGHAEFLIYGDLGYFHEPVLLRTEGRDQPLLRIVGHPVQISASEWRYTVKCQDGDAGAYVNPKYLQANMRVFDGGTSVNDEEQMIYGPDYYASMSKLGGQVGNVARKVEFTDKFLRREMLGTGTTDAVMSGKNASTFSGGAFTSGYNYEVSIRGNDGSSIKRGAFVSQAEARLAERIAFDKEMLMTFGRQETTIGPNGRTLTVGAGAHQLMREGHYRAHSGNLTLQEIFDDIDAAFSGRQSVSETKLILKTGSGGFDWLNRMIADEFSGNGYVLGSNVGSLFMRPDTSSEVPNAISVGGQFTQYQMTNGWVIAIMYDPTKDNRVLYPELVENTNRTTESYSFDIYDMADTDAAPKNAGSRSNVCMITDPEAKYYASTSSLWNINSGPVQDGGNVEMLNKKVGIYREESVGFNIWDTSRVMRFEYIQN